LNQTDPHVTAIIDKLRSDVGAGEHWYPALLDAIREWLLTSENIDGRLYRYLIAGEAFDLMLLAERLLAEISDLVPESERDAYLWHGKTPVEITPEEFKRRLGDTKYRQYLNYYYGVTVEEALMQGVEEEIIKEAGSLRLHDDTGITEETFRRIYDRGQKEALVEFCRDMGYQRTVKMDLSRMKEFYYWLFKLRLRTHEKARTASDTKKALNWLHKNERRG
jgi:hypothetical protein